MSEKNHQRYKMKFLHTSDWHLGKKIEGRERIAEQREVLNEIVNIADTEKVDVVLVAGDVFDSFVPPSEAEELFFDITCKLAKNNRKVVIISGNHDDSYRLSAPNPFAERMGIYIFGGTETHFSSAKSGNFHLEVEKNGERVFIGLLPYPNEARFKEEVNENEKFADKMKRWLNAGLSNNTENLPSILVGHFYTLGGETSEGERSIDLGGARSVDKSILPDCNYIALGHLHKRQVVSKSKNAYYSGAILEYAFDEAGYEKSVNVFEINDGKTENFKQIPLNSGKKLMRLESIGYENAIELLDKNKGKYIELTLNLGHPLTDLQIKTIKNEYPDVVSINLVFNETAEIVTESKRSLTDEQLFIGYYKEKYGNEPPEELIKMFLEIINETH